MITDMDGWDVQKMRADAETRHIPIAICHHLAARATGSSAFAKVDDYIVVPVPGLLASVAFLGGAVIGG